MARFNPEMGDRYQGIVASNEGDDLPTSITVLQAQKIANIIAAGRRGHLAYQDATEDVIDFLETAALETLRDNMALGVQTTRSAAEIWSILDELPWPISGPPQDQPDTN